MRKNEEESHLRRRVRLRPVRRRIGMLLVVPLLSLVGLWIFAAATSLGDALARIEFTRTVDDIARPIGGVGNALQQERSATAAVLASGGTQGNAQLLESQKGTDAALTAFRQKALPTGADVVDGRMLGFLRELDRDYSQIGALRAQVAARTITPLEAINQYNVLHDSMNKALVNLATADDIEAHQTTQLLINIDLARDLLLREDAILAVSQPQGRRLSTAEYAAFTQAAANRRHLSEISFDGPSPVVRDAFRSMVQSPQYARYQQLEESIVASSTRGPSAATMAEWQSTLPPVSDAWWQSTLAATAKLTDQTESSGRAVVYRLALVGGLGLLVVVASIVLSLRFVRDISRELRNLQQAAGELAHQRLPRVVARLRQGEEVDVDDEAPAIRGGRTQEIESVAEAFGVVQRTAVETAVGEAKLRAGVSRVFVNLAWRSQSLLQRQLRMLDEMERRTSDPDELENLFRLDHLTTRMRRHAEGLVILSGNETVRGRSEPVSVEHLLRAAVAEIEDYARVDVMALSQARVVGSVAADVVHLLAELVENATAFSPPTTEVLVRAEQVGNGLAVEVVDRGVGLDAEDVAAINRRLADPPEFDLADSDRLGLFVVARLAARHGIEVTLQRSAYGGITAVALLPMPLLASGAGPATARQTGHVGEPWPVAHTGRAIRPGPEPAALMSAGNVPVQGRHRASKQNAPVVPDTPVVSAAVQTPVVDEAPVIGRLDALDGGEAHDAETGGLPRRARQQSLAPQLRSVRQVRRAGPSQPEGEADHGEGGLGDRPAESNRDLLSSLQAGWTAARDEDED